MIIVVAGIKGGTGKSTIAFHLATHAFWSGNKIVTYDCDFPQFSFSRYYENRRAAIIKVSYGKGVVVLSGVHFEIEPEVMRVDNPADKLLKNIVQMLMSYEKQRVKLVQDILAMLGC